MKITTGGNTQPKTEERGKIARGGKKELSARGKSLRMCDNEDSLLVGESYEITGETNNKQEDSCLHIENATTRDSSDDVKSRIASLHARCESLRRSREDDIKTTTPTTTATDRLASQPNCTLLDAGHSFISVSLSETERGGGGEEIDFDDTSHPWRSRRTWELVRRLDHAKQVNAEVTGMLSRPLHSSKIPLVLESLPPHHLSSSPIPSPSSIVGESNRGNNTDNRTERNSEDVSSLPSPSRSSLSSLPASPSNSIPTGMHVPRLSLSTISAEGQSGSSSPRLSSSPHRLQRLRELRKLALSPSTAVSSSPSNMSEMSEEKSSNTSLVAVNRSESDANLLSSPEENIALSTPPRNNLLSPSSPRISKPPLSSLAHAHVVQTPPSPRLSLVSSGWALRLKRMHSP